MILFNVYNLSSLYLYQITKIIGLLLFLQIILGIFAILSGAQMLIASMHQIISIFLVSSSVYLLYLNSNNVSLQPSS